MKAREKSVVVCMSSLYQHSQD